MSGERATSIYANGDLAEQSSECVSLLGDRKNNQDRAIALSKDQRLLLIVADGMGGHSDGALAAQCVIDVAQEIFFSDEVRPGPQLMQHITLTAHQRIAQINPDAHDRDQPRTTLVACLIEGEKALFGHAGDSRGYHIRRGEVFHRTLDHSAVSMMVQRGDITEDEAKTHPLRNQVSRCLGGLSPPPALELTPCPPLQADDHLLLCSDGFWDPLSAEELCSNGELQTLAETAVSRKPGRADNCTVLRARPKT
ncbi:MAG: PP2C family protein-serine/threonine phosphatase [Oceanococcus sp.]